MRKLLLLVMSAVLVSSISAQVFNTGQTLKKGTFSAGVEPTIIAKNSPDFILFGHFGYGIKKGIDFGAKIGVLGPNTYVGADIEFGLTKNISLSGGAHVYGDFGLDATLLGTYPATKSVNIFGGVDVDAIFGGNTHFPLWIPVGVEVGLKKSLSFILEANIGLNSSAYHVIGGGVVAYF